MGGNFGTSRPLWGHEDAAMVEIQRWRAAISAVAFALVSIEQDIGQAP